MRKLQKHRSRDQWWYFFGKAIENGKWHTARSNILFGTPILKFIDEKEIDFLTVDNENKMRTNQPKKALYLCQHCSKSSKRNCHLQNIYQDIQLLMRKHHQKMKARQVCNLIILIKALVQTSMSLFVMDRNAVSICTEAVHYKLKYCMHGSPKFQLYYCRVQNLLMLRARQSVFQRKVIPCIIL